MTCLSDFALDRIVAGEASAESADHCAECAARLQARRAEKAEFVRTAPALPAPRARLWMPATFVAAAAAVLLFVVSRPPPPSTREKGAGHAAAFVRHDGAVRRALRGESVAAGDAVQIVTTLEAPAQIAVVGRDATGRATVYRSPALQAAGSEVPLDFSIVLDATRGEERLTVLTCAADAVVGDVLGETPPGCSAEIFVLVKP